MIHFKLAELRKKNNLTQQELGDILNVSYQTISKWENSLPKQNIFPILVRTAQLIVTN